MTDADLVVAFLNTVNHETGVDVLTDQVAWQKWLAERGLADAPDAASVRAALRAAVGDPHDRPADAAVPLTAELTAGGPPRLVATDVVGAVLAAATRLVVLDRWERVKICPADDCRWAFYDRSRNHSRTWCSMRVCGNREKARTWRERRSED